MADTVSIVPKHLPPAGQRIELEFAYKPFDFGSTLVEIELAYVAANFIFNLFDYRSQYFEVLRALPLQIVKPSLRVGPIAEGDLRGFW